MTSRLFFPNTNCLNKNKQFFGIDISKDVFDVVNDADNHYQGMATTILIYY